MDQEFLGFGLCNLLVPGDVDTFEIATPSGAWTIERGSALDSKKAAIQQGQCAETYLAYTDVKANAGKLTVAIEAAFEELLPISLGLSYLTGLAVTPTRSLPNSFCTFVQIGPHFPRQRAMGDGNPAVSNVDELRDRVAAFVANFPSSERDEKARLLVHHWLDALACWSLEDLVLSSATMLEIIAATAETTSVASGNGTLNGFTARIAFAATHYGLPPLALNFRNMRNDLVHQGHLSATRFPNKDLAACAAATSEALHWIDLYMHAALKIGAVARQRFDKNTLASLNAFSLD